MKRFKKMLAQPWAAYTFAACSAVLLYLLLSHFQLIGAGLGAVWKLLSPVVIGVIVAYLLNPVSEFFNRKIFKKVKKENTRHLLAVVMTVVCLVLVLAVLLVALIPSLGQSVSKLISNWDSYTEKIESLIDKLADFAAQKNISVDLSKVTDLVDNSMSELVNLMKNNVKTILSALGSVGSSVSNFAVGILFGVCFLVAKKSLLSMLAKLRAAVLKKDRLARNNDLWSRCNAVFIRYVGCTLLDALIIGVGVLIFTLAMRMPYAGLIAAVCGITNIIPTFGPMIGSAIGIFFLILDKPLNALWFFIFICIWQSIDGMIIKPRLFSGSLGIPAVWTLVLIILGGKVAGILGILLAVPVAAIFVILYQESIAPRLEKRKMRLNGETELDPETETTKRIKE